MIPSHLSLNHPQFSLSLNHAQFSLSDTYQSLTVVFPVCLLSLTIDVPSQCPLHSHPPHSLPSQFPLSHLSTSPLGPRTWSPSACPLSVTPCSFPSQFHCGHSLSMCPSQHPLPSSPSVPPFSPMPSEQPHTRASVPSELTHSQAPASNPSLALQTLSVLSRQTSPAQNRFRRLELIYFHGFPYWFPT